ncbi:XdhC family protein [Parvibaculum sp.]|uniref:XdhC family protein n=1 Tax=Parvibaculum sp. TaxID=2024848 RepID=UPI000C97EEF3|nr:XdhC family protein [Parvibaculum sp.]MAB13218.1 xanthine dehydrogenase [Parvibaculum sp.]
MNEPPETISEMDHDKVLEQASNWLKDGHKVALATVIETWGSAPRPVGSQLAIRDDATFTGSVSGGCIEGDVVTRALDKLDGGAAEVVEYGVSDAKAWEVGLACGGRIRIMIEPVEGNA